MKTTGGKNLLKILKRRIGGNPEYDSFLVTRCHALRKIPVENFTIEDLRIMIGQQIGLLYLIPLAIEVLREDIFAEGDFYPGDLLRNVLNIDTNFWKDYENEWHEINELIKDKKSELKEAKISTEKFDAVVL